MLWMIGAVKMTLVRDLMVGVPAEILFPDHDPSVIEQNRDWLAPYMDADGFLNFSVHSLILQVGEKAILVDTCYGVHPVHGRDKRPADQLTYLADLAAAGFRPEDIDIVLCTHLHDDHVGWNTRQIDDTWVPTFPNARYLFGRVDYDFWAAGGGRFEMQPASAFDMAVRPLVTSGQAEMVDMNHRICEEVWLAPTPGHSPGHVAVHISSAGERAVITGDCIHHPVQFAAPHWQMFLDEDPALAVASRTQLMEEVADGRTRVFGSHFPGPSSGYVTRVAGGKFRFD